MLTLIEYLYRDASNYKEYGTFVLDGDFQICAVQDFLADREFFIPERVGLKSLVPTEKTVDDHYLHSLEGTSTVDVASALMSAELFVERIKRASREGWFYENLSGAERQVALAEGRRTGLINPDCELRASLSP